MPPFAVRSLVLPSLAAFSLRRLSGLKSCSIDDLSAIGKIFLLPKKSLGVASRDAGLAFALDLGLDAALGAVGLNVLAAGLGLNSWALTLNFAEVVEVGVRTVEEACELGT